MAEPALQLHPDAIAEARAAYAWYMAQSAVAARALLFELDEALTRIRRAPDTWPAYVAGTRRYLLRHFPYFVVYRRSASALEIIAVAHARRRPGYWQTRET